MLPRGSSRDPSRWLTLPTCLRLLPCGMEWLVLRRSFIFLRGLQNTTWSGHPTISSLTWTKTNPILCCWPLTPFFLSGTVASVILGVDFSVCGRIATGNSLRNNIVRTSGSQAVPLPLQNSCNMYDLIWEHFMQTPFNYVFIPLHCVYCTSLMFSCKYRFSVWVECFCGLMKLFQKPRCRGLKLFTQLRQSKQPPHPQNIKC